MTKYHIDKLSLEEKIGQLFVFGFDALKLNDHAIKLIREYKAGNVILFARNVKTPEQVFELNKNLQKLAMDEIGIPLFISIDQEGGMVTRIKNGATYFPGAMTLSASHNLINPYKSGQLMGKELKALGINMNLAPSLDVNNNPYNPVIGVRSFGDDPLIVSEYGIQNILGLQENVIATAKHFPGHGDTSVDSHLDLPKIEKSLEELKELELIPFIEAIDNGVKAIMSAHINFPAVTEDGLPTTLSKNCLMGLLREELGFEGLIVTDCMQMKAIQTYYTTHKGALKAIQAGANLIMVSHDESLQIKAIEYVKEAVINKELSIEDVNERVERILKFKSENLSFDESIEYIDVQDVIESRTSKAFALDVVREAITLVKGRPIDIQKKTLLVASEPISTTIADENDGRSSIIKMVHKELPSIDTLEVSVKLTEEEIEGVLKIYEKYDQVVFCSYNANIYQNQLELIRRLNEKTDLYVIAMRNPYDLKFVPEIKNLTLVYEYTPDYVQILIEYLKEEIAPEGVMPIRL